MQASYTSIHFFRSAGLIIFVFLGLSSNSTAQQLAYRSVFNESSFMANPAMTSRYNFMEFGATYRQQWLGFADAPRTATLNLQVPFADQRMAIGSFITHDQTNPLRFNAISFTYNYKFELGISRGDRLSIGILGTLSEFQLRGDGILVNDTDDSLLPANESSSIQPNLGGGIFYQSYGEGNFEKTSFFIGVAATQLLKSELRLEDGFSPYSLTRELHGNALVGVRIVYDDIYLEPSAWVNYAASSLVNGNVALKMEKQDSFWAGLAYSTNSTASFQAGLIMKGGWLKDGTLRIGTLGTYNVGSNGNYQGFGYEFYIAYRFEP
ncbi:MAG: PorP/SprF family type IX secretion system membrane protein [Bacteroidota bacterium]